MHLEMMDPTSTCPGDATAFQIGPANRSLQFGRRLIERAEEHSWV